MSFEEFDEHVRVHALLGGAVDNAFDAHPEADAILVGTQDQLLSRARRGAPECWRCRGW